IKSSKPEALRRFRIVLDNSKQKWKEKKKDRKNCCAYFQCNNCGDMGDKCMIVQYD
ncbi:hypothetical protein AVEN_178160-1, partial [Araneus ventricosus]